MKIGYLPHIDGLRALAVVSVLLFHIDFTFLSGGYVGVDIFFVISGYLITNIIIKEIESTGTFSLKQFYLRRFRRLMPAYFATALVTTLLSALLFSPGLFQSYGSSLVASLFSVSNIYFWIQADYFDTANHLKPLLHTWSLSVEEQFYVFWPLTVLAIYKLAHKKWVVPILLLMILISLLLNVMFQDGSVGVLQKNFPNLHTYVENGHSTIFYNLPFRVFEFAIGAALVFLPFNIRVKHFHNIACALGLILISYGLVFFTEATIFPSFNALIPAIGTALVIYSGGQCQFHALLTNKFMLFVGVISYSLYLVHWPIVVFYKYLLLGQALTLADQVSILILSLLLGYLSYKYVETPLRKPIKNDEQKVGLIHRQTAVIGAGVFILLGVTGLHINHSAGWSWRVNNIVNISFQGDANDFHKAFYGGASYLNYNKVPIPDNKVIDIILIGDSHARQYAYGIDTQIVNTKGKSLQVDAGTSCFHLPGYTRMDVTGSYDQTCPKAFKHIKDVLATVKNTPLVVISHYWTHQIERAYKLDDAGGRVDKRLTQDDILASLLELKREIGDSQLLVIGQVPTSNTLNIYDVVSRPNLGLLYGEEQEWFMFSEKNHLYVQFNNKLRQLAETTEAFTFLDPFDVLCDVNHCRNFDNDMNLIYSDKHHLSKVGSVMVIEHFKDEINSLLSDVETKELVSN